MNIRTGELSGQLGVLRGKEGELSEGVRVVEEDVREKRRERERECRSRVADVQAEAIRLRRELEVRSCNNTTVLVPAVQCVPTFRPKTS